VLAAGCWKTRQRGRCPSYPAKNRDAASSGVTLDFPKENWVRAVRQALQVASCFEITSADAKRVPKSTTSGGRVAGFAHKKYISRGNRRGCRYGPSET